MAVRPTPTRLESPGIPGDAAAHEPWLVPREYLWTFVLVTALFFLWGIPNNLNDVLIRQFMKSFSINRLEAGLVQSAFYIGYFVFSLPAALFMRRRGYQAGLVLGLVLYGAGAVLFWPAALIGRYAFFLFALFVIASGLAFLETGANSFVAQVGSAHTSERRLNFCQAFNPLGCITGVLVGTVFIFSGVELTPAQVAQLQRQGTYHAYLRGEIMRVVHPYMVLGGVVFICAALLARCRFPPTADEPAPIPGVPAAAAAAGTNSSASLGRHLRGLLRQRHFVLAIVAQFAYVGAQVGTWSYFIPYAQDAVHLPEKDAGFLLTASLVVFAIGRIAATYAMRFASPARLMGAFGLANVALVLVAVVSPGWAGVWALLFTSFFMSLMYPTIFALGQKGLGEHAKLGASLLVMAIIGGAAFTPLIGLAYMLTHSMALSMLIPAACYIYVAYFSFFGSQVELAPA